MRKTKRDALKRAAALVALVLCIVTSLRTFTAGSALNAKDTAKGGTLRLEKTEGEVAVKSKNGRLLTILDRMKLFNGYALNTENESRAYIGLDDVKTVCLEELSQAEVRESGSKLELDLKTGSLNFNVEAPLKEDESLDFRAPMIVLSVRGTSGWMRVIDENSVEIGVLTGEVRIISTDPLQKASSEALVRAGKHVMSYVNNAARPIMDQNVEILSRDLLEWDIPMSLAQDIRGDSSWQKKITEQTDLDVDLIIKRAGESVLPGAAEIMPPPPCFGYKGRGPAVSGTGRDCIYA
jgi:ferric-dicitrate binding protein FerR (iron transport regulator)